MEGIQVSTEVAGSENQLSVIKVGGYIDTTTSSEVERALNGILKQGRYKIVIDLGNVDYISSAGWGIFISEIKSIRENAGDLKLVRMIPDVYEIFELLEFHHILDVYDTTQEAIQKFEETIYADVSSMNIETGTSSKSDFHPPESTPLQSKESTSIFEDEPIRISAEEEETQNSKEAPMPSIKDLSSISVEDKVKHIISKNPNLGSYKINKKLNTLEFGYTKLGWFAVRSLLNKLGLNNKKNRRKFAEKLKKE
jgi:anti-sigma B factor antagonist